MPLLKVSFESQDQADAAMSALRRNGVPFTASYQSAQTPIFPGGYLAQIVYPMTSGFSAMSNQQNPGYLVATGSVPAAGYPTRETSVTIRLNSSHIDRATSLLRNNGALSISQ